MIRQVIPPDADPTIQPKMTIIEVTDPKEIARAQEQHAQGLRNMRWLEGHWGDLLPAALGKFVAVAGQEAFVADTAQEAIARAQAAHPDDMGLFVQYLSPKKGPRIYGNRG